MLLSVVDSVLCPEPLACYNSAMSTMPLSIADIPPFLPVSRFTTEKYLHMVDAGVLGPSDKVELIGGVVVDMSPAGIPHNQFLIYIVDLFMPLLTDFQVAIQATLPLDEGNVFDPDFMLLRRKAEGYKQQYPQPEDVKLLIEASGSSLKRDREVKLSVYAAAGIEEYWIADLDQQAVIVHREPQGTTYRAIETRNNDDILSPLAAPAFSLTVRHLFE